MMRHDKRTSALLRAIAVILLPATDGLALEPTHTITATSGATVDFTTGPWTPAAPPVGGDASYVLGLHTDVDSSGFATIDHDYPATFELHGMLVTSNGSTSDRTTLTGSDFLMFDSGGEAARIEQYGLGQIHFDTNVATDGSLSIYNPSIGTTRFYHPLDVAADLTIDGFVYNDLSASTTAFVDLDDGAVVGGAVEVRGAGMDIGGSGLTGASQLSVWNSTRITLNMSGLGASPDLIEDTIPVVLEGGRIEITGAFNPDGGAEAINQLTLAAGSASELELETNGGFFIDQLTQGRGAAALILTRGATDDVFNFGRATSPFSVGNLPEQIGAGDNDVDGDESDASIVPFLVGSSDPGQRLANTLVTVNNGTGELRLLDPALMPNAISVGTTTTENLALSNSARITSPTTVNAIAMQNSGVQVRGSSSLTITSGVLTSASVATNVFQLTVADLIMPNDGYLWANNITQMSSKLTVTNDFTKAGLRRLDVLGDATVGGKTAFAEGETNIYADFDSGDTVSVGIRATLRLMAGSLTTPELDISQPLATFEMTGGVLQTPSVIGSLSVEGGTFAPGMSPALTTVDGGLFIDTPATLQMEIGGATKGTQYDSVDVTGAALLGGELDVLLVDTGGGVYDPHFGDSFDLLTATGGIVGKFDNVSLPAIDPGLSWSLKYGASDVTLSVVALGDANGDGHVDGLDYLIWAGNYGDNPADDPPGSPENGDFNNDNVVDGLDYLAWASNFGQGPNDAAAVPEPGTLMLGGIFGAFYVGTLRRRR